MRDWDAPTQGSDSSAFSSGYRSTVEHWGAIASGQESEKSALLDRDPFRTDDDR